MPLSTRLNHSSYCNISHGLRTHILNHQSFHFSLHSRLPPPLAVTVSDGHCHHCCPCPCASHDFGRHLGITVSTAPFAVIVSAASWLSPRPLRLAVMISAAQCVMVSTIPCHHGRRPPPPSPSSRRHGFRRPLAVTVAAAPTVPTLSPSVRGPRVLGRDLNHIKYSIFTPPRSRVTLWFLRCEIFPKRNIL